MNLFAGIFVGFVLATSVFWKPDPEPLYQCVRKIEFTYGDTCAEVDVNKQGHCVLDQIDACLK